MVELLEYSPAKIEEFKRNVSDSPAIRFESAEDDQPVGILQENAKVERDITKLYPGFGISNSINAHGTIGYRVTCNNAIGFMTAGHVVALNEIVKNSEGTKIGVGDLYSYYDGGTVDATFVKVEPSFENLLTNNIGGRSALLMTAIASEQEITTGTSVAKEGAVTGYTIGKIVSVNDNFTDTISKKTITKQITTTLSSQPGDSGSPVMLTSNNYTVGIVKGRAKNGNTVCTLASEIKKKFYCERY